MSSLIRRSARFVAGRLLPRAAYPVLCGPLRGLRFSLGALAGDGGGSSVYFGRVEPEQTRVLVDIIRPGDVFIDVGANVGYYTMVGARGVGTMGVVVAVEPSIRNVCYLQKHVEINRLTNVLIVAAACSDQLCVAQFSKGANFALGHLSLSDLEPSRGGFGDLVPSVTVDSITERLGRDPSVIKIDVEGAELEVLRGSESTVRRAKPTILISVHSDILRRLCIEWLQLMGYLLHPIGGPAASATEYCARPVGSNMKRHELVGR